MEQKPKFVVVIGTSAGGFSALRELLRQVVDEMDAAFFVVMHLSYHGMGDYLINEMQKYTSLICMKARDNEAIHKGHIYFAEPNAHLILNEEGIQLGNSPEENRWRPAIDVLFLSAATYYDGHTIGVILTGLLDDGTLGMTAIKKCGGTCIVQDPNEAEFPDMPLSVLKSIEMDYCIPISQMGATISQVIRQKK